MDNIQYKGLSFSVRIKADDSMREPWKEHDGHGIVSEWTTRDKAPGERALCDDRGSRRFYDFAETIKLARRDRWNIRGVDDEDVAALARKLGREPTAREVTAEAVERDFRRMRGWCNNEWSWVGVVVTLLDTDGNATDETESLWGIESDSPEYHAEVAQELAEQIAGRVGDARELVKRTAIRKGT